MLKGLKYLLLLYMGFFTTHVLAQSCPPNIDFESGTLLGWKCDTGRVLASGTPILWESGQVFGKHDVFRNEPVMGGEDYFGGFPTACPNGSGYSMRLGNSGTGAEADRITYNFRIPDNADVYSIVYWYAVVFQNPNHAPNEQPKFTVRVTDETDGTPLPCASFTYVVSPALPGFLPSLRGGSVLYKSWTPVTVNLNKRAGHTIQIEFTTEDCSRGGHFGYAYVDVDSDCDQPLRGAGYCIGDPSLTLDAPFGFERYAWYVNRNFSSPVSTSNRLVLNPPPSDGTQYSLVLKPFEGYGCEDTLHTVVRWGSVPRFDIVGNNAICLGDEVQMDAGFSSPDIRFKWSPSFGLSHPDSSKTRARPVGDTRYILSAIDKNSGCTVRDTFSVRTIFLDTVLRVSGDTIVCGTNPYTASLKASGPDIAWYRNGLRLPAPAVPDIYAPDTDGRYYAIIRDDICIKQTNTVFVRRRPKPAADYSILRGDQCFLHHEIKIAAKAAGIFPVKWQWTLGDGRTLTDSAVNFAYTTAGAYRPLLTITSVDGCKDTISRPIQIFAPPDPKFDIENACVSTQSIFTNRTITPPGDMVNYWWNLGNGVTLNQRNAIAVYDKPGVYTIALSALSDKCPEDTVVNIRRVNVQYAAPPKKQKINTALGYPAVLSTVNKGMAYKWIPLIDLSSDTAATPTYSGNADRVYLVRVTSPNGCFVVDTVQLITFNKADILVPAAFTPNRDGRNDRLKPITAGIRNLQYFRIWNRWGQLVYQSVTDLPGWDGTYQQLPAPAGAYVWEVRGVDTRGYSVLKKGTVVLIR